jgi:PAS domain-containing protein
MNEKLDQRQHASPGGGPDTARPPQSVSDAFYALDRGWRFTYLNGAAERLLRRGRGELLGRNVTDRYGVLRLTSGLKVRILLASLS